MAFKIIRNDITKVCADAIVNTANPKPIIGQGTDTAIYKACGQEELLAARQKIGVIERGKSAWTESYNLKKIGIKYIIHTVGICYEDGKHGETEILRSCYSSSLNLEKELGCKSVAIPLLATGNYSFPKELGLQIAVDEITNFLIKNEIDVTLVVYDRKSYLISEKLFSDIQSFIDENYTGENKIPLESSKDSKNIIPNSTKSEKESILFAEANKAKNSDLSQKNAKSITVNDFIKASAEELNFQNTLQKLIADRNLENSMIYKKAFVNKKFFSKIIGTKNYIPKKTTVMAFGLALKLNLDEYESFLASAGYAFMPSSKFDMIIKYCVINRTYRCKY